MLAAVIVFQRKRVCVVFVSKYSHMLDVCVCMMNVSEIIRLHAFCAPMYFLFRKPVVQTHLVNNLCL